MAAGGKGAPVREFTKAQKARHAIREFKTLTDALAIRGFYRPSGKMGRAMEQCLQILSPEIYGSMNDARIMELKGLEYVIDRLPKGIEECNRIILTEEDPFKNDALQPIIPLKRRRTCYRVGPDEMCFRHHPGPERDIRHPDAHDLPRCGSAQNSQPHDR
jgi:hypothetical protein